MEKIIREFEAYSGGLNDLVASVKTTGKSRASIFLASILTESDISAMCCRIPPDWRGHGEDSVRLERALKRIAVGAKALGKAARKEEGAPTLRLIAESIPLSLRFVPRGATVADAAVARLSGYLQRALVRRRLSPSPARATRTVVGFCTDAQAAPGPFTFAQNVVESFRTRLGRRLLKKGIAVQWNTEAAGTELMVRIVTIDPGNQFLRWLLPFVAPAVVKIEGQLGHSSPNRQPFQYTHRAHFGLAGGAPRGMLRTCAHGIADKIARDVVRWLETDTGKGPGEAIARGTLLASGSSAASAPSRPISVPAITTESAAGGDQNPAQSPPGPEVRLTEFDDLERALKSGSFAPERLPREQFKPQKTTLLNWNGRYFQFSDGRWVRLPGHPTEDELRGFGVTKERWSSGSWGILYRLYVREQKEEAIDSKGDFFVRRFVHTSSSPPTQVEITYTSPDDNSWYAPVYLLFSLLKKADLVYVSTLRIEENSKGILLRLESPIAEEVIKCINATVPTASGQRLAAQASASHGASTEVLRIYPDRIVCDTPLVKAGFLRALGGFPRDGSLDLSKFDLKPTW